MRSRARAAFTTNVSSRCCASAAARGLIRRIHGDLHLGNIVLIDGKPVLFDAIEFSPIIASGDVLYDLAFLLMDLLERGLAAAANIVLNRYLAETRRSEDFDALAALPFFLSMRAAIRAKVTAARLEQTEKSKHASIARSATAYFKFAQQAIAPPEPAFIAVGGLSGTGKSLLARALAPHITPMPGAVVVRSDVERKAMFGAGETDKLAPDAYTPEVTARVYATLADKARRIIAAGHSVIVDAVFARPQERATIAEAGKVGRSTAAGPIPHRRSRHPHRACRDTRGRCLRRRREGGAGAAGTTTSAALDLDRSRCLGHAG